MSASTLAQLRFLKNAAHLMRLSAPETSAFLMARRTEYATLHQEQQQQQQQQLQANGFLVSRPTATDARRQYICSCCGHILIPGCNGTVLTIRPGRTIKTRKKSTKKGPPEDAKNEDDHTNAHISGAKPPTSLHRGIRKVFTCGLCGRDTVIRLPPPAPKPRKRRHSETDDANQTQDSKNSDLPVLSHTAPKTATDVTTAPPAKSSNASSKKRAKNRKTSLLELLEKSRDGGGGGARPGFSFDDFRRR